MFRRLSTELTLIYTALFAAVMTLIAIAVFVAVEQNSNRTVQVEMNTASAVFDRLWDLRQAQLSDTAVVLARDFGFRDAVATADEETILSALDNIRSRFTLDTAFVVDLDGHVYGLDDQIGGLADPVLMSALEEEDTGEGLLMLAGHATQAVARPIRAPTLIGWVVFGQRLGPSSLGDLEKLSATPLSAHLYVRSGGASWVSVSGGAHRINVPADELARRVETTNSRSFIRIPEEDAIAGVKPLRTFADDMQAVLLLEYSLTAMQAPYRNLLVAILGIALFGLLALVAGSWFVSGRVTGPISSLGAAAARLARGEIGEVVVGGRNEISELADNFNRMSLEIAAREKHIIHLAQHESETGLPNLRALDATLVILRRTQPAQSVFALAIGIQRFESIRGAIGHEASARLISTVAARVTDNFDNLQVGRSATDTVTAVFDASDMSAAQRVAASIVRLFDTPVSLNDDRIDTQVTLGLACAGADADVGLSLLERAEVAVAQARAKREVVAVFDRAAYGSPADTLSLMSRMIAGLQNGEMSLAHQPKLNLRAGRATGAECLIRWRGGDGNMIRPDQFIGIAEETGHIRPLTDWTLSRAVAEQRLLRQNDADISLSVNISGRLIADQEFAEHALKVIARSDARLCFEITETAVIENTQVALQIMNALNSAGVEISIDDYGSGLSSLAYLKMIPARELKIDKMFVDGVSSSSSDALLVQSTIDLAHGLGMSVTAEGVEDARTLELLSGMKADTIQGFYVARPMPLEQLKQFLASETPEARWITR